MNQPLTTVTASVPDNDASLASIDFVAVLDEEMLSNETEVVTLTPGTSYTVGSPDSATATIVDATATVDANGNGIPDVWALDYFGNLTNSSTGDNDGDGLDNYGEWVAGTDPTNRHSVPALRSLESGPGRGAVVNWSSASNRTYTLKLSTNLAVDPFSAVLTSHIPADPPMNVYTDGVTRTGGVFSRVLVAQ